MLFQLSRIETIPHIKLTSLPRQPHICNHVTSQFDTQSLRGELFSGQRPVQNAHIRQESRGDEAA